MATTRRASASVWSMPRWSDKRGWTGGAPDALYCFTCKWTGNKTVRPGGSGSTGIGPECTVRQATRVEAEEHWQKPLSPGWKVSG